MKKEILIIIIFCSLGGLCHGQNKKVDSLVHILKIALEDTARVNTLNTLAYEFTGDNNDTAIYFARKALALAVKLNYQWGIADALHNIGLVSYNLEVYKDALKNQRDALKIYDELFASANPAYKSKILNRTGETYNSIGLVNYYQGNYPEGLKNYFMALRIFEETGNKRGIAVALENIGSLYDDQGDYSDALKNYLAALKINKESGNKQLEAGNLNDIGSVYDNQRNFTDALKNYLIALKINQELGNKLWEAINLHNIGNVYSSQGNSKESIKYHLASLKISEETDNKDMISSSLISVGMDYTSLKNFNEASQYLNKGLLLGKELNSFINIQDSYMGLTALDSAKGNFKQAFEDHKMYIVYRDSVINNENTRKTVQLQMQYEFDKKEAEHDKKDALALKELQRQKLLKYFLIGGIGLLLVLFFFVYRTYRARQLLRLNDIRNKIAGDLHDDIGSTLNSISIYSEVARKNDENHDEALEMIGDAARKVIDAMSDIVWVVNSENDNFENIIFRMNSLAYNLFRAKKIEFTFEADETLNTKKLSLEDRRNFYLIFKEAINNLVKYSGARCADITLDNKNDRIRLRIKDDGVGFDTSGEIIGNGLKSMKRRADEMGAVFVIDSHVGGGTQIELTLNA